MIALPLYLPLIVFGLFLVAFLFFSIANIVLLARFGARNAIGFSSIFVFISVSSLILFLTWQSVAGTEWSASIPLLSVPAPVF